MVAILFRLYRLQHGGHFVQASIKKVNCTLAHCIWPRHLTNLNRCLREDKNDNPLDGYSQMYLGQLLLIKQFKITVVNLWIIPDPISKFLVQDHNCWAYGELLLKNYSDVIMSAMASQITSVSIVCSGVCSGADQREHQSSAWLAFVKGIHRWSMKSLHKGPVTRKMFPFDDVIMKAVWPWSTHIAELTIL